MIADTSQQLVRSGRIRRPFVCILLAVGICSAMARDELKVVAHPDTPCLPKTTVVWTAAMQSAFDRIVGPKSPMVFAEVVPNNRLYAKMLEFSWKEEEVMPDGGWFAVSGPGKQELADQANEKWRELSGGDTKPFTYNGTDLVAFVGIKRNFLYKKEFIASVQSRMQWGETKEKVRFFGTCGESSGDYSTTVRVLGYVPGKQQYALQCLAKEGDDTMVLFIPNPGQTMLEAMASVRKCRLAWDGREQAENTINDKFLHSMDDLRVPKISLAMKADLTSAFVGAIRFKDSPQPWRMGKAETQGSLEVDSKGVKFEATVQLEVFAGPQDRPKPPIRRQFWFDRPFFLFLWRDGAEWPYAGVWFGSAETLVK